MIIDHLVELLYDLCLCLHLPLQLVESLQDHLHVNGHLVDVLTMAISPHPDLVDLVIMGLEHSTNLLGNQCQIALQLVPLWY